MNDRFRPTRAGVINVWDYVDEEWVFADGRLALRGHNGSGKTKALEVLFPFVLDGVADSRRLDPFSGENRTMKSNLLYRGQESEYGYVWMEFARPGSTELNRGGLGPPPQAVNAAGSSPRASTVTLIIGMRAHRNTDGVRMSFYATGKRLGVDFGLLSADSRPLTERQLKALLEPDAWRKTATEYRDLVDSRLFGLGRERYAQLLDLLLALRRPLLAKDLDPVKVSDTLTSGLSPVDEYLVQQAARDFENLAAVQKLFDDLTAANAAVQEFLTHYTAYLRAHVKFQLDRVQARTDAAAGHAEKIAEAAAAYRGAIEAERQAETERNARRDEGETLQGRLTGLKNSEEYKAQGRIEDKRREMLAGAREVAGQRSRLGRDRDDLGEAEEAARKLSRRAAEARNDAERYARDLTDAAQRSGIADDGFGPVDSGDDLLVVARARVAARRDDVGEIRRLLDAIRDAKGRRSLREQDLGDKETTEHDEEQACAAAEVRLAQARQTATDDLAAWTGRWAGPAAAPPDVTAPLAGPVVATSDTEALGDALEGIGEPGATSLTEVFDGRTAERQATAITARANLETDLREVRQRLAGLYAERDAIAAAQDDAPPASDLRPARRAERPGAPLWRLVRFADGIDDAQAAAVEGALYGAGLLTAWVHPDTALTEASLAAAEPDGYLVPSIPLTGRTLADILVPEEQDHVAPAVVTAVLRSVALTDDIADAAGRGGLPGGPGGMDSPREMAEPSPRGQQSPAVSTKAQFTYGVHVGARPKAAPEYIGATNRANRRRARLAEYDELIKAAVAEEDRLAGERDQVGAMLEDFRRARRELPDTRPVARAAEAVGTHAVLLARARDETAAARTALDGAIAEVDARTRQLRQAAAERRMPTAAEHVDAIARAAAEFENAATQLHAERAKLTQAEEDLAAQAETIERRTLDYARAEAALAEREGLQRALEEEFRTLEEALQADVQQVLEQIRETEKLIAAAERAYRELDTRARAEHDRATTAEAELRGQRQSLAQAVGQLYEQAAAFGEYARPDLYPLAGVTAAAPWPDPARWPGGTRVGDDLAASLARIDEPPQDPADAVRGVLPPGVTEILDAFAAATRGGRQVTEGTLKNTADRMSIALKDFTEALAACDEDYRVDWEPGAVVTVHVIDDEGRKPVAAFATRIAERAADQGVLLEDRERKVLEDELLAALAQQIHGRVVAARDLTREMNSDTRSKPMSSGIAVGIRWAQSDKITDLQRATSRLLERDSPGPDRLAELRGMLRDMIREYRVAHPRATYREALASVLDYRSWHAFELVLIQPGEPEVRLTRAKHSVMSGGEKSAAIHLPLFAAANALYSSAKDHCPRMIALDEAFVGIDERYKPDLFGLAVKFDLDLFMTGHDLWVRTATVPMIAHYDMYHDKTTRTVSSLLMLWDGDQLVDTSAGYEDNEALVAQLLGFRPTRHAPLGAAATLYTAPEALGGLGDEPDDEYDDADSL
jgi:Putative exonuclease SbcCD, C subunit